MKLNEAVNCDETNTNSEGQQYISMHTVIYTQKYIHKLFYLLRHLKGCATPQAKC